MIITIHQPEHLPWLGFFNKLSKAEYFVILDNVQFEKNYFQNRNKIMNNGEAMWIGIPIQTKGHMNGTIASTLIATQTNPKWKHKYLQTIKSNYGKHPYFSEIYPIVEEIFSKDTDKLYDINVEIIKKFSDKLGFHPTFVRATDLDANGAKSDLVLNICKKMGATRYIAGPSGRDYMDLQSFKEAGIEVVFNDYKHPEYPQKKVEKFVPYLSTLDLLMNCGFEESRRIIIEGNEGVSLE